MSASLYLSQVMHRRFGDVPYRFRYPVFSLLLDIDRLEESAARTCLLKLDRFALVSFYRADHGPRDGSSLRRWADNTLAQAGIDLQGGQIQLLCFPRVLGYGFSPLSVWYCRHADGSLRAVIAEVNNTFGEHHHYLLHAAGKAMRWPAHARANKLFHVSPLLSMHCDYRFLFFEPGADLKVVIRQRENGELRLIASQTGNARPLTDRALLRALIRTPLMPFKVIAAIHWQALKIWLRGGRFHKKPVSPLSPVS
jgi:DUF1365 family protein